MGFLVVRNLVLGCMVALLGCSSVLANDFSDEDRKMQEGLASSDLGKFTQYRNPPISTVRKFSNSLHREAMRQATLIQTDLAQSRENPSYNSLYAEKEKMYVAARTCAQAHTYFNDVNIYTKINATSALSYAALIKTCDSAPMTDFLEQSSSMRTRMWRDFGKIVDRSVPGDEAKKAAFSEQQVETFSSQFRTMLGDYQPVPGGKRLRPIDDTAEAEVHHAPLIGLPTAPFQHTPEENKAVQAYVADLIERITSDAMRQNTKNGCSAFFKADTYNRGSWASCLYLLGLYGPGDDAVKDDTMKLIDFSQAFYLSANKNGL